GQDGGGREREESLLVSVAEMKRVKATSVPSVPSGSPAYCFHLTLHLVHRCVK
ncbi:Uncharacterized protein DAT39_013062, partial [Clarias magur]